MFDVLIICIFGKLIKLDMFNKRSMHETLFPEFNNYEKMHTTICIYFLSSSDNL